MNILYLALAHAEAETKQMLEEINENDTKVTRLLKKIAKA